MNQKLEAIADRAGGELSALIKEGEAKILEAWDACAQEAQDNDAKPKFKLGFSITLDLDADALLMDLTWGIKHKLSVNTTIPDPNQIPLPIDETMVAANKLAKKVVHPKFAKNIKDLVNPVAKSGGISSMTISGGGKEIVIDQESAKRITENCDKILKGNN